MKDGNGQFIASGSSIRNHAGEAVAVVGFDGQSFIDPLTIGLNRFTVSLPENGGSCRFELDYPETHNGSLPDLGEITCIP